MRDIEIFMTIVILTVGTMMTRFLPFLLFPAHKEAPSYVKFLGEVLPYAVMGLLVVYCLKDVSFGEASRYLPQLIAIIAIVVLHYWKKNTLVSIAGGTLIYMFLIQVVFS